MGRVLNKRKSQNHFGCQIPRIAPFLGFEAEEGRGIVKINGDKSFSSQSGIRILVTDQWEVTAGCNNNVTQISSPMFLLRPSWYLFEVSLSPSSSPFFCHCQNENVNGNFSVCTKNSQISLKHFFGDGKGGEYLTKLTKDTNEPRSQHLSNVLKIQIGLKVSSFEEMSLKVNNNVKQSVMMFNIYVFVYRQAPGQDRLLRARDMTIRGALYWFVYHYHWDTRSMLESNAGDKINTVFMNIFPYLSLHCVTDRHANW